MLLLHFACGALLFAHLAQQSPMPEFLCQDEACYAITWTSRSFTRASRACDESQGHLMTVKTPLQTNAITLLMAKQEEDNAAVWIGLQQPEKETCTDLQQPLRGFTWVTGDTSTDYSNWRTEEQKCGALCATVRNDGTWGEADCAQKVAGYLCEFSYVTYCKELTLSTAYNVTYYHNVLGFANGAVSVFPPGTHAHFSTLEDFELYCKETEDGTATWSSNTPEAWTCLIENGGCEYECAISGTPECRCPPGLQLKEDNRTCSKPCDTNPCSQFCDPLAVPPYFACMCDEGYSLAEDGKTCEDIDDCAANPNLCEYGCTNTIGSFICSCKSGFEMVDGKCQDIDECDSIMCEHDCENYEGGYTCVCREGFVIDENNPKKCKYICNTPHCEALCHGSERKSCQCPDGYVLEEHQTGKHTCAAIDECDEAPCILCIEISGSYECTCPEGYIILNNSCIPEESWNGVEEPPDIRPSHTFGLQPSIMLGIFIAVISMVTVLIAFLCHIVRKHYMEKHSMDYKYKNMDDTVVLQYVKVDPWGTL